MCITFADALLALPVDATLRAFFERCSLALPPELDWNDRAAVTPCLLDVLVKYPRPDLRRYMARCLRACLRLAQPRGRRAVAQVFKAHADPLPGLLSCRDALHRAFWLMVWHPILFEKAVEIEYFARRAPLAQQHDLGSCTLVRRDATTLANFRDAVEGFSQKKMKDGERCVVRFCEGEHGTVQLRVYFQIAALAQRQLACPSLSMALEYAPHTGVLRTVTRAGEERHALLARAFSLHFLGAEVERADGRLATLNLAALIHPCPVPVMADNKLVALQVQSITVVSPDTTLKAEFSVMDEQGLASVTDLVAGKLPHDNPLANPWMVVAARLNLYFAFPAGKPRSRVIAVDITRRGRLNLHRFDEPLRAQIEHSLVRMGIFLRKQTLSAHLATFLMAMMSSLTGCAV